MRNFSEILPTTRREFLGLTGKGLGLLAFSRFAPSFLVQSTLASAPAPEKDRPILVIVQLAGGNDGLNTVIPFADSNYYHLRPTLAVDKTKILAISDHAGFQSGCESLQALVKEGRLAVIQNVGYPNPNRSHFRSTDIWQTASDSDRVLGTGWVGRYLDNACAGEPVTDRDPLAIHLANEVPTAFLAAHEHPTFGLNADGRVNGGHPTALLEELANAPSPSGASENASYLRQTMMDALVTEKKVQTVLNAYQTSAPYPNNGFAHSLRSVASLIAARMPTRVYFVSLSGFDTHAHQAGQHQKLLQTLSEGLAAFQHDLDQHGLSDQVLTMTFSEFGRRPMENESHGTDHGTAAPLFVMGSKVKAGLHGTAPNLNLAHNQDITFTTDFRQVYGTVLDRWLGCPSKEILGKDFAPIDFIA